MHDLRLLLHYTQRRRHWHRDHVRPVDIVQYVLTFFTSELCGHLALLGILGFWGQELDPVTLVNVLMAIGFSVDFR